MPTVHPAFAIDRYARGRQIDLALSIAPRAKIYLDVRFWIIAREAADGTRTNAAEKELLRLLRAAVGNGTLCCPISESTFVEVMKQTNTPSRRIGTARMIDELSLGVSIVSSQTRIATEIGHLFYAAKGERELHPMQELVWTKLTYAFGYLYPYLPGLDSETQLLQKDYFDKMWGKSLTEIVATIGDWGKPDDELQQSAKRLEAEIKAHSGKLISHAATYRDEVIGTLDALMDLAAGVMASMAENDGITPPLRDSPEWKQSGRECRNLLIAAFEQAATKSKLRTIHALASLHAGLRWDRQTKFTANHYYDFEHAAAAVAYCDAFLLRGSWLKSATRRTFALVI